MSESLQELSLVFHEVDGVTAGSDLTLEFRVLELVGSIFSTTLGGLVSSKGSNIIHLGCGSGNVLLVVRDSEGEVKNFTTEVGDSGVKTGDFTIEAASEGGESFNSLSLSFSLDGEGGLEVVLDIVKDSEEGIDHTLVGDSWGSFSDHGNDVEDLSVTVGESFGSEWLESSDVGGELVKSGGLDLKEVSFGTFGVESFLDDRSSLMHHGSDGGVLGNGSGERFDESLVLSVKGFEHSFSLAEFSLSVDLFLLSVGKDWTIDHFESLVLDNGSLKSVGLSVESVHFSSASVSDNIVFSFGTFSFGSKTFSDFFNHRNNMGDVVFRFKLEFDGVGESFTKFRGFDFSKEVGSGVGSDDAKYEDSNSFHCEQVVVG